MMVYRTESVILGVIERCARAIVDDEGVVTVGVNENVSDKNRRIVPEYFARKVGNRTKLCLCQVYQRLT